MTEPAYKREHDFEEFRKKYPEFFEAIERERLYESKNMARVLREFGPELAHMMAEVLRTRDMVKNIEKTMKWVLLVNVGLAGLVACVLLV